MEKEHLVYSLYPGRFSPLHDGHKAFIRNLLKNGKNVCIAIRDTKLSHNDPYSVRERIDMIIAEFTEEFRSKQVQIAVIPDISEIVYGRGVGFDISKIDLPDEIKEISGTKIREAMREEDQDGTV